MLSKNLVFFFVSAVLSVDFFLILSVQVRLSATSLSEVALKVWQAPCTLSASVGPASQTELSASAALLLCVLWTTRLNVAFGMEEDAQTVLSRSNRS